MQNPEQPASPWKSRIFVIVFVAILALIIYGFIWIVQSANETLPQTNEIITLEDAAARIDGGGVERILIQEERDVFLYLPGQPRPLYSQLALGETFTTTMQALGVSPASFPPLTVESD
ncbi:MAG: hypothetical protein KJZ86_05335 [Caldilineaceae bacterium]|nr:hypothetical protein [Caldilineaceae bacterium]HRJ40781.1 hypothetical protein [Caldilineaceae bacterium]